MPAVAGSGTGVTATPNGLLSPVTREALIKTRDKTSKTRDQNEGQTDYAFDKTRD